MQKEKSENRLNIFRGIQIISVNTIIAFGLLLSLLVMLNPNINKYVALAIESSQTSEIKTLSDEQINSNHKTLIKCMDDNPIEKHVDCYRQYKEPSVKNDEVKKVEKKIVEPSKLTIAVNKLVKADLFIQMIYMMIIMSIVIQFSMYYIVRSGVEDRLYDYVKDNRFYISEYCINSPITFGVIATLYSFAIFALNSTSGAGLMEVFKVSVYDAVGTTLIGGVAYTINLGLNVTIQKEMV